MKVSTIKQWDLAAQSYSRIQAQSPVAKFNRDFISQLVPGLAGKRVLDAGCGDGYYADYFRNHGALVCGCDGSAEMVRIASEKYPLIQFDLVDLQEKLPYENQDFDLVFCNMVLMDIETIEKSIAEMARVLKTDGTFIFSILHPCFYLGKWETDRLGRKTHRKIHNYLKPQTKRLDFWGQTSHYHRPLSYYLNLMPQNRLWLERLYEPAMPTVDLNNYERSILARIRILLNGFFHSAKCYMFRTQSDEYITPSLRIPFLLFARLKKSDSL